MIHGWGKWYATVCYKVNLSPRAEPELVAAMDRNCGQVAVVYSDGAHDLHRRPGTRLLQTKLKRPEKAGTATEGLQPSQQNRDQAPEAAPAPQKFCQYVASPADPSDCRQGQAPGAGEARCPRHEQERPRDRGLTWQQRQSQGGTQPLHLVHRLERDRADARLQNPGCVRQPCLHLSEVLPLRTGGQGFERSQSTFHCTSCGYRASGDLNSAQNILASGVGATARGEAFSRLDLYDDLYDRETGPGHSCNSRS